MSVILRHKQLPFIMVYHDPKKSWDSTCKKKLLEEIEKDGFDNFVDEASVPSLFYSLFNPMTESMIDNDEECCGAKWSKVED